MSINSNGKRKHEEDHFNFGMIGAKYDNPPERFMFSGNPVGLPNDPKWRPIFRLDDDNERFGSFDPVTKTVGPLTHYWDAVNDTWRPIFAEEVDALKEKIRVLEAGLFIRMDRERIEHDNGYPINPDDCQLCGLIIKDVLDAVIPCPQCFSKYHPACWDIIWEHQQAVHKNTVEFIRGIREDRGREKKSRKLSSSSSPSSSSK